LSYLTLQLPHSKAAGIIQRARRARVTKHVAKDILRASNLPLLPADDEHVGQDLKRIQKGKALSPIILVQGDLTRGWPFIIADGYHRVCSACHADEDAPISAILVKP
jgi:hypothetical protein